MQEVGEVLHLARSGRVIVQLTKLVDEGQILCDEKSSRVAKVMELIGPVRKPYASATPLTNNIKKYTGKKVFAIEYSPAKKQKKIRRKRK
ncbi:MAG TPA: Gar1/Naf1 family protein [Nitrosopumilaceae archaeon]|nr:Gar1/Naf1 family protein [Nitrosopumilaceae archaeon]